jgi:predicted ATPase
VRELPRGTVTFLFTDIEGSTRLLQDLGPESYAAELAEHRRVLREAFERHEGVEVDTQGDAFFIAFGSADAAVAAAATAQTALAGALIRVRMGLHSGAAEAGGEGYVGLDVHLGARVAASGHGGQVLLSQATRELVDAEVVDLGEHRLKDFPEPVWVFQLPSAEPFPPLKTISNTNLPRPASTFVGRERECADVVALMRGGARLVTLTGPGGSGKTRLAIEAAAEVVPEHRNGVFWVGLATLRDAALVLDTIAQTLGAKDGVAEHVGDRELLILLDNLEQVIEAAPELASLVEACPNLRLLVTSRELLRVRGEVEYAVLPLADPDAVDLFCARAGLPPDEPVEELCRRLDNLPLAIELAAARAAVLTPPQILERLSQRLDLLRGGRDAEARQKTLRATIAWSHDLLGQLEQQLFARLAVFDAGCTLAAAEEVADADLDTLQSLVEKSLLRHDGERFWMLETVRDFARERLVESGAEQELWRRHAEHVLELAETARPRLLTRSQRETVELLADELDNVRGAIAWGLSEEPAVALAIASALEDFWLLHGHLVEARHWLEQALARASAEPTTMRARALGAAAWVALRQGDRPAADAFAREGLTVARKLGDAASVLTCLGAIAILAEWSSELDRARELFNEGLELARAEGDRAWVAGFASQVGQLELACDNVAAAVGQFEEASRLYGELGDDWNAAITLLNLGFASLRLGRFETARQRFSAGLELSAGLGNHETVAVALLGLASADVRPERAVSLLGASGRQLELTGAGLQPAEQKLHEATIASLRSRMTDDAFGEAWAAGRSMSVDDAVSYGLESLD